ncbi:MAG: alanine racemase [Bacillaceae bacterium]
MTKGYFRDTWVEINLDCIYNNVVQIKNRLKDGIEVYAVVKANGYGHGAEQVALTALEAGATRLAVAFLDEAISLRQKGITAPILVLGATNPEYAQLAAKHHVELTVFREDWLLAAELGEEPLAIHLKLDTGMGRLGLRTKEELIGIVNVLKGNTKIELEGVYTHFATADELDDTYVNKQIGTFRQMLGWCKELDLHPASIHCANSATTIRDLVEEVNGVRLGIAMYGLSPSVEMAPLIPFQLQPAFSMHSCLTNVKKLEKGACVSYGATYCTEEEEWIGTVPVGYADGWPRRLQGFHVLINGEKLPIIGRVCMDQFMVRLSDRERIGTEVVLIGEQGEECICAEDVAAYLGTINYEIICMIGDRVPRVYKRNGQIVEVKNPLIQ